MIDEAVLREAANTYMEDIQEPYDVIFKTTGGFDALKAVCDYFSGCTVYIPSLTSVLKKCLERKACAEFTGDNHAALSKKYGFTERQLRNFLYRPKK
jgi:Mor family transcriptional regulator